MARDLDQNAVRYRHLVYAVDTAEKDIHRLSTTEHPGVQPEVERVEQWRNTNHARINETWHNAMVGLTRARLPQAEPIPYDPPTAPPTAEELAEALDFAPAMNRIERHLPHTATFAGFGSMRRAMHRRAIWATAVTFFVAFMVRPHNPYDFSDRGRSLGALIALLVCLGFAFYGWVTDCRPVARRDGWKRTDARYVGAACLAVLMPTLGSGFAFYLVV